MRMATWLRVGTIGMAVDGDDPTAMGVPMAMDVDITTAMEGDIAMATAADVPSGHGWGHPPLYRWRRPYGC